jgi:hypothetical protein
MGALQCTLGQRVLRRLVPILACSVVLASASVAVGAPTASDACPNADLRTGAGSRLPGCRAYEQVSPTFKNGGDVVWAAGTTPGGRNVSTDGTRALFAALTEFAGAAGGGSSAETEYFSERTAAGWETEALIPRANPPSTGKFSLFSDPSLTRSLLISFGTLEPDPPNPSQTSGNLYERNNVSGLVSPYLPSGEVDHLVTPPSLEPFVFQSFANHTSDAGVPPSPTSKVYERVAGELRLVSVMPDGTPAQQDAYPAGVSYASFTPYARAGGVSDDGRHVFFSVLSGFDPADIYRRSDGTATVRASESRRTPVDPSGPRGKQFWVASADGDRVFFTSAELLTDDANTGPGPFRPGSDLYRYDFGADELVDLTATAGGDGAQVDGVVGFDDAARRVYYVARGAVVDPPGPSGPVDGEPNLYLWEDDGTAKGKSRFVATLSAADSSNWLRQTGAWSARTAADGRYLVFQSEANIPGSASGSGRQVYRYDADAAAGAGELACVSCNPRGDVPRGPSSIPSHARLMSVQRWEHARALSEDGRRVFFNSEDALVARDTNGEPDAYMWEAGEVSLLSTGTSSTASWFYNASSSGDDAFILTREALVAGDGDDLVDLYDVRVGGGFPPQPPTPDCVDDACQGDSAGPSVAGFGSAGLLGRGDVDAGDRPRLRWSRLSAAQLRALAHGRRVRLRVRVTRAGTVRATMRAKIGQRRRVVARGSARVRRPGRAVISLRLAPRAVRQLRRVDVMRASLTVRATGARSRALTFRLKGTR